ncbi:MAG TPA: ROK family transcriptional regulator [Solirubrobacteraceae bacterium]|jgi:predicted NBD/HSP70 family sugar kinase|nr:ROK family transcriptional regulator [Solirubrobacteraceae bacterium]
MSARELVVDCLWREGPLDRAQVVRDTRLSRATVSRLIGELQAEGLVDERPAPRTSGRSGRPTSVLAIEPRLAAVGGIDFGHGSVRVALADLAGTIVAEARHELDVDNEPRRAIEVAVGELERLGRGVNRLLGVGAAISAPVRRDSGMLVADGILPGWRSVSLGAELRGRLGVAVHVGNDANLGALAEVRGGAARGADNVVYLMLSSGIGAGLILDGTLFTGHSGMTGELGHVVVDPGGAACRCGHRGCLETVAGARAVNARAGDRGALHDAGRAVGRVAGAVCNLVNPELVIVGGELIVAGDALVEGVRAGVHETAIDPVWRDVSVLAAELGDQAELLGAIGLALAEVDADTLLSAAA